MTKTYNAADYIRIGEPLGTITADKLMSAEERLAESIARTNHAAVFLQQVLDRARGRAARTIAKLARKQLEETQR